MNYMYMLYKPYIHALDICACLTHTHEPPPPLSTISHIQTSHVYTCPTWCVHMYNSYQAISQLERDIPLVSYHAAVPLSVLIIASTRLASTPCCPSPLSREAKASRAIRFMSSKAALFSYI